MRLLTFCVWLLSACHAQPLTTLDIHL